MSSRTSARNVSISFTPSPVRAQEAAGEELANAKMLTEPVAMIAPGQEMRSFYDRHIERGGRDDLPSSHQVSLRYQDFSGHEYSEESVIDVDAMRGTMFTTVKTIHDIAQSLADIQKTLGNASVLRSHGALER